MTPPVRFAVACVSALSFAPGSAALADSYQFMSSPHQELNRIFRVDTATGEMGACQYGLKDGTFGVTLCYPAGEGAVAQTPGEYSLVPSSHRSEAGIMRVNKRTGEMSVCFVLSDEKIVCTPPAR